MTRYKSALQPFCRWCGKPIKKWTCTVAVRAERGQFDQTTAWVSYAYVADKWPATLADCQKLTNEKVVSVKRLPATHQTAPRRISSFGTWDGETYEAEFFDSGPCATAMGHAAAGPAHGLATAAWRTAVASQKKKGAAE